MTVRVRADAHDRVWGSTASKNGLDRGRGAVVRHLEHVGREVESGVEQHLLRRLLGLGGEQDRVLAEARAQRRSRRCSCPTRCPSSSGRATGSPTGRRRRRARRRPRRRTGTPSAAIASVERRRVGRVARAPGLEQERDRDPRQDRGQAHDVVGVRMARDDDVEPLHAERGELRRDLRLVGPPSTRIDAPPGDVSSAASPCPTSKNRTVSAAGGPARQRGRPDDERRERDRDRRPPPAAGAGPSAPTTRARWPARSPHDERRARRPR